MSIVIADKKNDQGFWLKHYTVNGKSTKTRAGRLWNALVTRTTGRGYDKCYDVAENNFIDFNHFAGWCQEQHGYLNKEDNGYYWQLDKDIMFPGNKIYSPETCVFVPAKLNSIFVERENDEGLPIGVRRIKNSNRFSTRCRNIEGVRVHLGTYATPEEASNKYLEFKGCVVVETLELYDIDPKLKSLLKARWGYGDISREGLTRKVEQVVAEKVSYV